jgi:hypothetical protein
MYRTIWGESRWRAGARNGPYGGYAQFHQNWANGRNAGRWVWNRYNGRLNIRMFYYCVTHPRSTGGWSNWLGH